MSDPGASPVSSHLDPAEYVREMRAALQRTPERAVGSAETVEEAHAAAEEVSKLLGVAAREVNAARIADGRPVPATSGRPGTQ